MASDLMRRRVALAANVGAIAGVLVYVLERGYANALSSGSAPAIILREARVGFHLAITIAAFVALAAGLVSAELVSSQARMDRAEHWLERAALPIFFTSVALLFVWP